MNTMVVYTTIVQTIVILVSGVY